MEFRLLGAFEVWNDGQPVEIAGSKRRALLALLVLRANEVVRTERLIDELWGERPPRNAAAALRNHVSRLRKTLGADTIANREWGYVLRATPSEIDVRRFERLLADAEPLAAQQRATKLAEALALWRGPPLSNLVNESALQRDIARLEELRLTTLERRIDADLEAGHNGDLVGELEALVAEQPLREHLRWQLILALYRARRQAEALEVYRETRRVLTEELGLEPSPALRELEQAILRQDPSLDANGPRTNTEPPAEAAAPKRRRAPAALLALLALGLAGTATAIALVHPEKSASTGTTTGAIVAPPPKTPVHRATGEQKVTVKSHPTTRAHHSTSSAGTTSPKLASSPRPTADVVRKAHKQLHKIAAPRPAPPVTHKAHRQRHKVARPQKPITIVDDFAGNQIDGTIWNPIRFGSGWSMAEQDGHLEFSFPPNTMPGPPFNTFGGLVGTECKFPGDFDARADFALVDWPDSNGITVILNAFLGPKSIGWGSWRRSSAQWGEAYGSYTGTSASVALTDTAGTLRIARHNGVITAYFRHNGGWDPLTTGRNTTLATIGLGADGGPGYNAGPFGGQQATVDFNHFSVTGISPICPAGAKPAG